MRDMFGVEIAADEARRLLRRKATPKRGYAAPPGTGPAGETCRSCAHYSHGGTGARSFPKCGLMRRQWTSGPGTDILAKAPACRLWDARQQVNLGE